MKKININLTAELTKTALVFCLMFFCFSPAYAENDTTLNRSVTVERDFQPVIQAAGKVATKPTVVESNIEPAKVDYSDYTANVDLGTNFNPLLSQPVRFGPGRNYNGYLRGGIGHINTLFDFGYHLDDDKNSILDVYAHHRAQWGCRALSKSKLGLNFTHTFNTCNLYFGINGGNIFYHKYGHFYDYTLTDQSAFEKDKVLYPTRSFSDRDKTSLWTAEAFFGLKANPQQDFQYRFQTGYKLFAKIGAVSEHQIGTHLDMDWHSNAHHIGANMYVQNNFLKLGSLSAAIADSLYNPRHNIRIEPYYAYIGNRIQVHLGVNIDINVGRGHNALSGVDDISFAPSPHIRMEAQVAKNWLTVYMNIVGNHGLGTLQEYMEDNRYRLIHAGITEHQSAAYTPIDAELGFHIRPYRDLLFEIHAGYAYMTQQDVWVATADSARYTHDGLNIPLAAGDFSFFYTKYQRAKVGGQISYHYQDRVRFNLHGDYYFWSGDTTVYDRAKWELGLRIDGRIGRHWSLYSDNYLAGSKLALATDGEHILKPTIELNLGIQYDTWVGRAAKQLDKEKGTNMRPAPQPNLSLFFQLNNFINRKNDILYGYTSEGINFLLGATFKF
ncbi:MAG: hypothetical protein K6A36_02255 [Paludibacteraceae bacterium]|nr:hypothetical protein [Paludibacteraceae bacterium]